MQIVLTSEVLIAAYSQGLFPMAESADSPYVHWFCPQKRGQISITKMHVSRSLKKAVMQGRIATQSYEIQINRNFRKVIEFCARKREDRPETWINQGIIDAFSKLHDEGYAHSVECWQDGKLVGGLYGLALGGAFFGESMFSTQTDASKVALVHLVARLWAAGFTLLDTQFVNSHLEQFGVYEVLYKDYMRQLKRAMNKKCDFCGVTMQEDELVKKYFEMRQK